MTKENKIMMKQTTRFGAIIMMFVAVSALADPSKKEGEAIEAAKSWLALIDQEKYADGWNEASGYFKKAVKQEQLEYTMKGVRQPLGKMLTREVKKSTYQASLPGAPDGEYVIIEFNTSFENKKQAVESITPMLEKDGQWRVAGYFIK